MCSLLPGLHRAVIPGSGQIFYVEAIPLVLEIIATGAVFGETGKPTQNVVTMSRRSGEMLFVAKHRRGKHVQMLGARAN